MCLFVANPFLQQRASTFTLGTAIVDFWRNKDMKVHWTKDADAALADAKTNKKPLLIDFSAAPA